VRETMTQVYPLLGTRQHLLDELQDRFALVAASVRRDGDALVIVGVRPRAPGFRFDMTHVSVESDMQGYRVTAQVQVLPGGSAWALTVALIVMGVMTAGAALLFVPVPFVIYAVSRRAVTLGVARVLDIRSRH